MNSKIVILRHVLFIYIYTYVVKEKEKLHEIEIDSRFNQLAISLSIFLLGVSKMELGPKRPG